MHLNPGNSFLHYLSSAGPLTTMPETLVSMSFSAGMSNQADKAAASRTGDETAHVVHPGNLLVMLADDDGDDRELFTEVISEINPRIKVRAVEDGLQLMDILNGTSEELPSLIFLDLNMPRKSGKECLAEIRNNPRFKSIPVIIYSTSAHKRDIQETHGFGANLYVPKPNTFNGLIYVITRIFSLDMEQLKVTPPIDRFVLSEEMI